MDATLLTLLQYVIDCTKRSNIVSVPSTPEQHSSLLTDGLGGDREKCTEIAVESNRHIFIVEVAHELVGSLLAIRRRDMT